MNHPLIWAHRGASGYAPENTLPAFRMAAEMKADGVELDIQLTRDGEIVVCHDETIDRTSSGHGSIADFSLSELKTFDFCNGNLAYEGVRIPTLEEVLDELEPTPLTVNIELKTGINFYPGIEEKAIELVQRKGWGKRIIYSSFNHETLRRIHQLDPAAKTGVLYGDGLADPVKYGRMLGASALHPVLFNLRYPGFLETCREDGKEINVWTVNSEEHLKICREMGVHAVITNYPEKARKLYDKP